MTRRETLDQWFPTVLRYTGLGLGLFVPVVWLVTNRLEPALIGASLAMMGLGEGQQALKDFSASRKTLETPTNE